MERSTRLGRYRLLERIGRGGMAEVFLAATDGPNAQRRIVAVKLVLPHLRDQPGFETMFLREAAIVSRLDHPNIARVIDYGVYGDESFLAMEYVHGQSLRDILIESAKHGGLSIAASLSIVRSIAHALHHAHEVRDEHGHLLGLVHRDVSPSNVLVRYDGVVKLVDFGIAKATNRVHTTVAGSLKGKMGYMAPEQARCESVDRRADVFGLGILLYETTLGRRMFEAANEYGALGKVLRGEFTLPHEIRPDFPQALERILLRCLAPDPEMRFPTAREVALAVERFAVVNGLLLSESTVAEAIDAYFPAASRPALPGGSVVYGTRGADDPLATIDTPTDVDGERVLAEPITLTGAAASEASAARRQRRRAAFAGAGVASVLWAAGLAVHVLVFDRADAERDATTDAFDPMMAVLAERLGRSTCSPTNALDTTETGATPGLALPTPAEGLTSPPGSLHGPSGHDVAAGSDAAAEPERADADPPEHDDAPEAANAVSIPSQGSTSRGERKPSRPKDAVSKRDEPTTSAKRDGKREDGKHKDDWIESLDAVRPYR